MTTKCSFGCLRTWSLKQALVSTLLLCLTPFVINLVTTIVCLNTFIELSYTLTEVTSSPAFINNEYLICQNLLYIDNNVSLPVYQAAEMVTDVRSQFMKVLVLAVTVTVLLVLLLVVTVVTFPIVPTWQALYHSTVITATIMLTTTFQLMAAPLTFSFKTSRVEDAVRRYDAVSVTTYWVAFMPRGVYGLDFLESWLKIPLVP